MLCTLATAPHRTKRPRELKHETTTQDTHARTHAHIKTQHTKKGDNSSPDVYRGKNFPCPGLASTHRPPMNPTLINTHGGDSELHKRYILPPRISDTKDAQRARQKERGRRKQDAKKRTKHTNTTQMPTHIYFREDNQKITRRNLPHVQRRGSVWVCNGIPYNHAICVRTRTRTSTNASETFLLRGGNKYTATFPPVIANRARPHQARGQTFSSCAWFNLPAKTASSTSTRQHREKKKRKPSPQLIIIRGLCKIAQSNG